MRFRLPSRGGAPALIALSAGCYTQVPVLTPAPAAGTRVAVLLNDHGRQEAATQIGPYAMRVEGAVLQMTDSDYVLQVTDVVDIRGIRTKWTGETVPLRRSYVAMAYERRLHKGRTLLLIGGAAAILGLVVGFDVLGLGSGSGDGGGPPGPDPDDQ